MKVPIILLIVAVITVIVFLVRLFFIFESRLSFYSKGHANGFSRQDLNILWPLTKKCNILAPSDIFYSVQTLNRALAMYRSEARRMGTEESLHTQKLISKLTKLRSKIALKADEGGNIGTTRLLDVGQRLSILVKGHGVFTSRIANNEANLVIEIPRQEMRSARSIKVSSIPLEGWKGKSLSVYLWRKGDACYVFDTTVEDTGTYRGNQCLYLVHSMNLDRVQKRQSIRCECKIYAQLYLIKSEVVDYNKVEEEDGYKCVLEDISEDGLLIRIGGKGKTGLPLKIQFHLNSALIVMFGMVRAVEYNKQMDQSRLHFECTHIAPAMKNDVLTYIYQTIPESEWAKDMAIRQSETIMEEE